MNYSFLNPEYFLDIFKGRPHKKPISSNYRTFPFKEILRRKEFPLIHKKYKNAFIDKQGNIIVKGEFEPPMLYSFETMEFHEGFAAVIIRENGFRRGYYFCHFSEG